MLSKVTRLNLQYSDRCLNNALFHNHRSAIANANWPLEAIVSTVV